jgi:hypothetical protein
MGIRKYLVCNLLKYNLRQICPQVIPVKNFLGIFLVLVQPQSHEDTKV